MAHALYNDRMIGFPNVNLPKGKYGMDFGKSAALKIFAPLLASPEKQRLCLHYYVGREDNAANNAIVVLMNTDSAAGLDGHANHADHHMTILSPELGMVIATIGRAHSNRISKSNENSNFSARRYTLPTYALRNFSPSSAPIAGAGKAMRHMDEWFLSLGQTFGIQPQFIKEAFVSTLGVAYDTLGEPVKAAKNASTHSSLMRAMLPQMWGVSGTPLGYNSYFNAVQPESSGVESFKKSRRSTKTKSRRKKKKYY